MRAQFFREKLLAWMEYKNIGSGELAAGVGKHPSTVSQWRSGKIPMPEPESIVKLVEYIGVGIEEFWAGPPDDTTERGMPVDSDFAMRSKLMHMAFQLSGNDLALLLNVAERCYQKDNGVEKKSANDGA